MQAVILAGGKGTRLRPYTTLIPKPLMPIGENAIINILLSRLTKFGVTEVFLCLNHFADIIKAFLHSGEKTGIKINYSFENIPLGTVGPIRLLENLNNDFLVMNGDLLTDLNFLNFFQYHLNNESQLTVAAYERKVKIDFGVLDVDFNNKKLIGFYEKPEYNYIVSMGIYAMNKSIVQLIPENKFFGFDDLLSSMLNKNYPVKIYPYTGYWLDIGRPDDYDKANEDIKLINDLL